VNNEKILLQYNLKTEMSETVADVEEVTIVTATENIRSEIQKSHYQTVENSWTKIVTEQRMFLCTSFQFMKTNSWLSRFSIISSYNKAAARLSLWDKECKNAERMCVTYSLSSSKTRAKIEIDDETASRWGIFERACQHHVRVSKKNLTDRVGLEE